MSDARFSLEHGDKFPYDGGEDFWTDKADKPTPVKDWAHRAARGVLADLCDRSGVKKELDHVDHDVRAEMVESLRTIIREAYSQHSHDLEGGI